MLSEKERLHKVMNRESVDRPPCICPGGMMNMITIDLMDYAKVSWPDAHMDPQMMADLAIASYQADCFENVGVPFCMTVEAQAMGAGVTMGSKKFEPHVTDYRISSVDQWEALPPMDLENGREKIIIDAISIIKSKNLDAPIIGNLTGPISIASSVMEPTVFYKELRKKKDKAHAYMNFVTEQTIAFARAQILAGADVIAVSDPSGTGEILGPVLFEEFTVRYLNQLLDGIKDLKAGTIVHICGNMGPVYHQANLIHAQVLSFDSCVSLAEARKNLSGKLLMGNVNTYALEFGDEKKVAAITKHCMDAGADIVSPACGLGTRSPMKNIQAMLKAVKEYKGVVHA